MLRLKFFLFSLFLAVTTAVAQVPNNGANNVDITTVNVDNLTDGQIRTAWGRAQAQGYTVDQFVAMARARGMQEQQAMKLKQRILQLGSATAKTSASDAGDKLRKPAEEGDIFGYTGNENKEPAEARAKADKKNAIFGLDFFKNPKI